MVLAAQTEVVHRIESGDGLYLHIRPLQQVRYFLHGLRRKESSIFALRDPKRRQHRGTFLRIVGDDLIQLRNRLLGELLGFLRHRLRLLGHWRRHSAAHSLLTLIRIVVLVLVLVIVLVIEIYRSISPNTMSMLPIMATTSAI